MYHVTIVRSVVFLLLSICTHGKRERRCISPPSASWQNYYEDNHSLYWVVAIVAIISSIRPFMNRSIQYLVGRWWQHDDGYYEFMNKIRNIVDLEHNSDVIIVRHYFDYVINYLSKIWSAVSVANPIASSILLSKFCWSRNPSGRSRSLKS